MARARTPDRARRSARSSARGRLGTRSPRSSMTEERARMTSGTPAGSKSTRASRMARVSSEAFDVLVIGGGITGAGVALDAASRGLRTALVERDDFGSGTSSRSSKLVHGGLRYLSQGDYRLVAQALAERQRLLENAPHLVRPLPFLVPSYGSRKRMRAVSSALWLYDLTGGFRIGQLHR